MLDFGIVASNKTEDYTTKFLNELVPNEEIAGEIVIGEFKTLPMGKREVAEFYMILTDHEKHSKWVCELTVPYYPETDNIYGEKGGLFYTFIDSLNNIVNRTPKNWQENYSVNFSQFRKTVNTYITSITVKTVSPVNADAKTVNLEVISVEYKRRTTKKVKVTIYDLAEEDPIILMGYASLRNKGDRITIKNLTFELKSLLDDRKITENAYKQALIELKTIENND